MRYVTDSINCPLCGNMIEVKEDPEELDFPTYHSIEMECPSCHASIDVTMNFSYSTTMYARAEGYSIDEFEQEDIDSWPDGEKEAYAYALQKWGQEQTEATMKRLGARQETLFE